MRIVRCKWPLRLACLAGGLLVLGCLLLLAAPGPGRDAGSAKANNASVCIRLIRGDSSAISQAAAAVANGWQPPPDYLNDSASASLTCGQLTSGYWTSTVSQLELDFPIAFTIQAHKDFYQVNRLMQAVHRSHNAYCIHVDTKSSKDFSTAVRRLARCLGNVELAESSVVWGEASVLLADLKCFRALHNENRTWNYVINLTGQEYPIRTLLEMVRILRLMNGSNNIEKLNPKQYQAYPAIEDNGGTDLSDLRWYKGSAHAIISRAAVAYMMEDVRAARILRHIQQHFRRGRTVPDETFYATLNHNYAVMRFPGSYTGPPLFTTDRVYRQIYRYKIWSGSCRSGLSVRGICILGLADLPHIDVRPELVVNKLYYNYQSLAFRCLQERFWTNTRADYDSQLAKTHTVPLSFYAGLEYVQHHA